jgi:hypothetical protein
MPTIKQSAKPSMEGWDRTPPGAPAKAQTPAPLDLLGRSPFMVASMPLMASTGDAFNRQFYSGQNLPQQRILPVGKGAKA